MTYAPELPTTSDVITVTATVQNIGTAGAPASTLYISPPGVEAEIAVPPLASGASTTLDREITGFTVAQGYQVNAMADVDYVIPELSEGNNSNSVSFVVWTLRDAAGDATSPSGAPDLEVFPDLETASVRTRRTYSYPAPADSLFFLVRFPSPGLGTTVDSTVAQFLLDIDQDPGTGFLGVDEDNNDSGLIGVDYIVEMGAEFFNPNQEVRVLHWNGTSWDDPVTFLGTDVGVNYTDQSMYATIPLSALGDDDGIVNVKVIARYQTGANREFTGVFDVMSDVGAPVGVVYK
jgi:hypothetical protein